MKKQQFVIVYGPQATGKTLNSQAIAASLNCDVVVDDVMVHGGLAGKVLVLSSSPDVLDYRVTNRRKKPLLKGRRIRIETMRRRLGDLWVEPRA